MNPIKYDYFSSYTFRSESRPGTPQCLLSGDTSQSAGKNAFQIQSGALFSEKLCDGLNPRRDIPQRLPQVMTHIIIIMGYKGFVHFKNINADTIISTIIMVIVVIKSM